MKALTISNRFILVILLISSLYFILFIPANLQGSKTEFHRSETSLDENLQFSFLVRMLTPGGDWKETVSHLVDHLHYIYGYPFYVFNALVVLPVRILAGKDFANQGQWMLLLLRQFISVLPVLAAILVYLHLQVGQKPRIFAFGIFIFMLFLPGVIRQNIQWWHPDGLVILFSALTIYFLVKDDQKLGRHYYLAGLTCGLASAIKLAGFFFFLSIAWYLLSGLFWKKFSIKQAVFAGIGFVCILFAVFFFTNPLLLFEKSRSLIIATHLEHNYFFTHGWETGDVYDQNPLSWLPILNQWYADTPILIAALVLLVYGCFKGERRLLNQLVLAWIIPLSTYLLVVIAVRPDHYWLPVIIPLLSVFVQLQAPWEESQSTALPGRISPSHWKMISWVLLLILAGQFFRNAVFSSRLYSNGLITDRLIESCDPDPINITDGKVYQIDPNQWYLVEEFNLTSDPPLRKFYSTRGPLSVSATKSEGKFLYRCAGSVEAAFKGKFMAEDYKINHRMESVFRPDGSEVPIAIIH